MELTTACVHGPGPRFDPTGAVSMPIYQTATFAHPGIGQSTGFDYTRAGNPTRERLEQTVAALEGAQRALAFTSGMAAVTTVLELFRPGDHLIASADLYGGTHRLLAEVATKNGIAVSRVGSAEEVTPALRPETVAGFVETPTNPMMNAFDITRAAEAAHAGGALAIVDNTFLTPVFQRPLELGADVVVHSATKYLAGHNDTMAGVVAVRDSALAERLDALSMTLGTALGPFDAWLALRGIKTLAVRMERQAATASTLARWLADRPEVTEVRYPGLDGYAGAEIFARQASGHGAMIAFSLDSDATARRIVERLELIQYAESLGGVESLITFPVAQTHADVPEAEREALGITARLLRLSVGLEAAGDLVADLAQAFGEA
ncbi:MAG: PLP-dependent aspartate aminotransferase family protein [Bifidobacteriaceae bacterium]|jgi:cystathionine gamma-synthase|nr:PLP-dependent aspartate aminotransferase family protein [Bifidobacteriaceae bacterium]